MTALKKYLGKERLSAFNAKLNIVKLALKQNVHELKSPVALSTHNDLSLMLCTAARLNNLAMVEYLLKNTKVDVNAGDNHPVFKDSVNPKIKQTTAMHFASENGNVTMMKCLRQYGADINLPTALDTTPLHAAARKGYPGAVDYLLNEGAYYDVENYEGTPLELALTANPQGEKAAHNVIIKTLKEVNFLFSHVQAGDLNYIKRYATHPHAIRWRDKNNMGLLQHAIYRHNNEQTEESLEILKHIQQLSRAKIGVLVSQYKGRTQTTALPPPCPIASSASAKPKKPGNF